MIFSDEGSLLPAASELGKPRCCLNLTALLFLSIVLKHWGQIYRLCLLLAGLRVADFERCSREATCRMRALAACVGIPSPSSRSNLPARRSAASRASGRFVAPARRGAGIQCHDQMKPYHHSTSSINIFPEFWTRSVMSAEGLMYSHMQGAAPACFKTVTVTPDDQ